MHVAEEKQLDLALLFDERLPAYPLASNDLTRGVYPTSRETALGKKYIQFNHENLCWRLVFDLDSNVRHLAHDGFRSIGLPEPTWAVYNERSPYGHAHVCYELAAPIPKTDAARLGPLRYAAAVQAGVQRRFLEAGIGVDLRFAELLCKNPRVEDGRATILRAGAYELGELAEWVELGPKVHVPRGLGRNCSLFDALRFYAYAAKRDCGSHGQLLGLLEIRADEVNRVFSVPLPDREVAATVKSVAKWVWQRFDVEESDRKHQERVARTHTSEIQRNRGYKSGHARYEKTVEARNRAVALRAEGKSIRAIASDLSVSKSTVQRWLAE